MLTLDEVRALTKRGVDVQNHGWTHADYVCLCDAQQVQEVVCGREWLRGRLGIEPHAFAVPLGIARPSPYVRTRVSETWYCADPGHPEGLVKPGIFNRSTVLMRQLRGGGVRAVR